MTTAARPAWVRIDANIFDNPKFLQLQDNGRHRAILAWLQCLFYSAGHLTDGWVPQGIPRRLGYTAKDMQHLVDAGLMHRMQIDGHTGWLIHDYLAYQPPKEYWIELSETRRKAARARWNGD